mgnify:CR=1 FL=1
MYAIETKALTKKYGGLTAVDSLDLKINAGEIFCLAGVNGAGKSTTVGMLSCLVRPTDGDALVFGHSVRREGGEVKKIIGLCPQQTATAPQLSVKENLELMCALHGIRGGQRRTTVADTLERLSLTDVAGKKSGRLSGGYCRRLSIAMALINSPRVLFLDEPTIGLDVIARAELWEALKALNGSATVIFTTHYMEEAEHLADRIGIMKGGRMAAAGSAEELKKLTGKGKFEDAFISIVTEEKK